MELFALHLVVFDEGNGPRVSVIIPTYGDSEYVDGSIESVANQTYSDIEVVIVDSTGVDRLANLSVVGVDIEYVYQEPSGLGAARNTGIERATGDVVGFLDADDRWLPSKVQWQLEVMRGGVDFVYGDAYDVREGTRFPMSSISVGDSKTLYRRFFLEGGIPCPTVMARRECFDRHTFDESLSALEDRHLWVRLLHDFTPGCVPKPLAKYVRRDDSMSSDPELMYESELQVIDDLTNRYKDLQSYRQQAVLRAKYEYGKRLIRAGRTREARSVLLEVLRRRPTDTKTLALTATALAPIGNQTLLRWLEAGVGRKRSSR
ncbi:hypothetical protein DJ84_15600 [Halorubrum ezzemoulense]|nr:hypothetical protein DJ84_15600 [Halorubrum ezzemoulense]